MKRLILPVLLALLLAATTTGHVTAPIQPVPQELFSPIEPIPETFSKEVPTARPIPSIKNKVSVLVKETSKPKIASKTTSHSITGKASWYCKAGVSICHHSYPPGSMVAAACGKLRRAMGNWRGKTVTVQHGIKIHVKLVDYCASEDKLIDLYWEPMRRLGGTGTLHVRVSW